MSERTDIECPVAGCDKTGSCDDIVDHIQWRSDKRHTWDRLGLEDSSEFRRRVDQYRVESGANAGSDPNPGSLSPVQNELSELYDVLCRIAQLNSRLISSEDTPLRPDEYSSHVVQYWQVIKTILGRGRTLPAGVTSYEQQHRDRVRSRVMIHRNRFGDGEKITTFEHLNVVPLEPAVKDDLVGNGIVDDTETFYRPTEPERTRVLPSVATTREKLKRGLAILGQFPAYPDGTAEEETTPVYDLPVTHIYELVTTDAEEDVRVSVPRGTDQLDGSVTESLDEDTENATPSGSPLTSAGAAKRSQREFTPTPSAHNSPAAEVSPESDEEIQSFVKQFGPVTSRFRRIDPPGWVTPERSTPVLGVGQYKKKRGRDTEHTLSDKIITNIKKGGSNGGTSGYLLERLRCLIYNRIITDDGDFDLIIPYPGHRADSTPEPSNSGPLYELARRSTRDTSVVYAPVLRRTETVDRQVPKPGRPSRWRRAKAPEEHHRVVRELSGRSVILLDDISTSGASLAAGAHMLRRAGAEAVIGVVFGISNHAKDDSVEVDDPHMTVSDIMDAH